MNKSDKTINELKNRLNEVQQCFFNNDKGLEWFLKWYCEYKKYVPEISKILKNIKWDDELKKDVKDLKNFIEDSLWKIIEDVSQMTSPSLDEYRLICHYASLRFNSLFYGIWLENNFDKFKVLQKKSTKALIKYFLDNNHKDSVSQFLYERDYKLTENDINFLVKNLKLKEFFNDNSSWFKDYKPDLINKKRAITEEFIKKYPEATWSCKTMILSNLSWQKLCDEFFSQEESFLKNQILKFKIPFRSLPHTISMNIICLFFSSYLNSKKLDRKFELFIRNRMEEAFNTSHQEKLNLQNKEKNKKQDVQNKPQEEKQKPRTEKLELPEWMEEDIKNLDLEEDDAASLIKFLRIELTNFWWAIEKSHIVDRLKRIDEPELLPDFLALLDNYSEFCVVEDKKEIDKSEWDLEAKDETVDQNAISKEQILQKELLAISTIEDKNARLSWYVDMFEKIGYQFEDKEDFLNQFINATDKTGNDRLEKSVFTALQQRIFWYESLRKKFSSGYRAICLNYKAWRIVLINMKITDILDHDEYMKLVNNRV